MSNRYEQIKRDLISAVNASKPKTSGYDTTAEVLYEDGDTLWVKIPGGVGETPVEKSIAAKRGDIVQIRVANGRAWINGNNTAPPTDDTMAIYAREVAVETHENLEDLEEYFWHDEQGAHVLGNKSGYRNDIKSDGMHIVQTSTGDEVAKFTADGSQIGKDSESHAIVDYHSLQMYDRNGTPFFNVSDLRDKSGVASYTEYFDGNGTTTTYYLTYQVVNRTEVTSVKVDGVARADYTLGWALKTSVTFSVAPAAGARISIEYNTENAVLSCTLGKRKAGSIGMYSVAENINNIASGYASHVEGENSQAEGKSAHAEGYNSIAKGTYAHAEGQYCEANGSSSHAQNTHTVAASTAQTAMGRYNEADANSIYGLILGNGNSQGRSNALGVTWKGDIEFDIDRTAQTGTIDGDLMAALATQGWGGAALVGSAVVGTSTVGTAISGDGGLNSLKVLLTKIINAL